MGAPGRARCGGAAAAPVVRSLLEMIATDTLPTARTVDQSEAELAQAVAPIDDAEGSE